MASSTFVFPPNMVTQNAFFFSPEKPFGQFAALFFLVTKRQTFTTKKKTLDLTTIDFKNSS
jgi:hypothetical protein